jgi:ppGpp synthetase/RelA/SpoT-type nucleotidyltranferase
MTERTIEDNLRQEYFELLPEVRRVLAELEAETRYRLLPVTRELDRHERLVVTSRVKECESAVEALRRRQEGGVFDRRRADEYSLAGLNDLAGVRVQCFPKSRWLEADRVLRDVFAGWAADPVLDDLQQPLAFKYHGFSTASAKVRGELQIVSMLTGLFWEVEHDAIYKPSPYLKAAVKTQEMKMRRRDVLDALRLFDEEFDKLVRRRDSGPAPH